MAFDVRGRGLTSVEPRVCRSLGPRDTSFERYRARPGPAFLPFGSGVNSRCPSRDRLSVSCRSSLSSDLAVLLSVCAVLAGRRLRLELIFAHQVNVVTEDLRVVDRHVGEDLPVEGDTREPQGRHQPAVGHATLAGCGVDAGDPERPELRLAGAPVAVGVGHRVDRGLARRTDELALGTPAAFGLIEETLVPLVNGDAALD